MGQPILPEKSTMSNWLVISSELDKFFYIQSCLEGFQPGSGSICERFSRLVFLVN